MSGSQKALKVISILLIIYSILLIIGGILMSLGFGLVGSTEALSGTNVTLGVAGALVGVLGVSMIISGVIDLIIGMLGVRGSNNPHKIGPFFVIAIIGAVFGLIGMGMNLAQGTFDWSSLISLVVIIICVILAYNIRKETR